MVPAANSGAGHTMGQTMKSLGPAIRAQFKNFARFRTAEPSSACFHIRSPASASSIFGDYENALIVPTKSPRQVPRAP